MKTVVKVSGMTCNHCVQSVTTALTKLDDVTDVAIDLDSKGSSTVSITHHTPDIIGDIAGAIADAGYALEAVVSQS